MFPKLVSFRWVFQIIDVAISLEDYNDRDHGSHNDYEDSCRKIFLGHWQLRSLLEGKKGSIPFYPIVGMHGWQPSGTNYFTQEKREKKGDNHSIE